MPKTVAKDLYPFIEVLAYDAHHAGSSQEGLPLVCKDDAFLIPHCGDFVRFKGREKREIDKSLMARFNRMEEHTKAFKLRPLVSSFEASVARVSETCPRCLRQVLIDLDWKREAFFELCQLMMKEGKEA